MQRGMSVTKDTPKTLSVQIPELEMWCQWKTKATKSSMRTCFNYMGTILLALGFKCTILLARARAEFLPRSWHGQSFYSKCCMKDKRIFGIITNDMASFCLFHVFCVSRCVQYMCLALVLKQTTQWVQLTDPQSLCPGYVYMFVFVFCAFAILYL